MKSKVILFIVVILSSILFGCDLTKEEHAILNKKIQVVDEVSKEKNSVKISVNPNMELLSIVQYLGKCYENDITKFDFKYTIIIDEYFKWDKNHDAVKFIEKRKISSDVLATSILYLDSEFNLREEIEYSDEVMDRLGGVKNLEKLAVLLKKFYIDTNFHEFYESNVEYYNEIIDETIKTMGDKNYIKEVEDYYGINQNSYNLILVSLFKGGGYGPKVEVKENKYDIYSILGPINIIRGTKGMIADFGNEEWFEYILRHEFGHSFVNYLGDMYYEELKEYDELFNPIKDAMRNQSYSKWITCVNEHIVRAVTTRMAYGDSKEDGDRALNNERGSLFIYIDELVKSLEEYESDRDKYPTFEEFYPELIKSFQYYLDNKDEIEEIKSNIRSVYGVFLNGNEKIVVVPTNEKNENEAIREYVNGLSEFFKRLSNSKVDIITDEEALKMDLSEGDVIIYGTMEGNKLLSKYKEQFHFEMGENSITFDGKENEGEKIQYITVVENPENEDMSFIIYTANDDKYIEGINNYYHVPSKYSLFIDGDEVIPGVSLDYEDEMYSYLRCNYSEVNVDNLDDFSDLSIIDSDLNDKEIFFTAESHGVKANAELEMKFLRYFKEKTNFKYYLCEIGYSNAYYLNKFLLNGDVKILEELYKQRKGTTGWNKDSYNHWIALYEFNKTLPEDERIEVVGIDLEHQPETAIKYMYDLLPKKEAPQKIANIIDKLKDISNIRDITNETEFFSFILDIRESIEENKELYEEYLGEDFFGFNLVNNNILYIVEAHAAKGNTEFDCIRDKRIYENFEQVYERLPKSKYYGQWGLNHALQKEVSGVKWLAGAMNEEGSELRDKVLSIVFAYDNCEFMYNSDGTYNEYDIHTLSNKFNTIDEFVRGEYNLFKLNGEDSPFVRTMIWPLNQEIYVFPRESVATDYFQYLLVIRNSGATEPLNDQY